MLNQSQPPGVGNSYVIQWDLITFIHFLVPSVYCKRHKDLIIKFISYFTLQFANLIMMKVP